MSINQSSDIHVHHNQPIALTYREFTDCPTISIRKGDDSMALFTLFVHQPDADQMLDIASQLYVLYSAFTQYAHELRIEEGVLS